MNTLLRRTFGILGLLAFVGLGACASSPKAPVYANDPYNAKQAEAFTLNFHLAITLEKSMKPLGFKVVVVDRATGKEIDLRQRDIKVFGGHDKELQLVEKKSAKNEFHFTARKAKYCWDGAFEFWIEDPRQAQQKTTASLYSLCEAAN